MLNHHPLRQPRRTRRVNHIRRTPRTDTGHRRRRGPVLRRHVLDHRDGARIAQQELDPLLRQGHVDRQVHATRLEHRQHGHDHVSRAGEPHGDHSLRPNPVGDQLVRQPVRLLLHLGVGQLGAPEHQRGRVRSTGHLRLEHLGEGQLRHCQLGSGPLRTDIGQPRQVTDQPIRFEEQHPHQVAQLTEDPFDGGRVEQRGVVPEFEAQLVGEVCAEHEREVRGVLRVHLADPDRPAARLRTDREVLEDHGAVEQAGPGGHRAPAPQLGQRDEVEAAGLGLGQLQLAQPRQDPGSIGHPDPSGHRVDEHADHRLHAGQLGGPPGHGRAEHDVRLTAVPGQQQGPSPLDEGVEGEPVPPSRVTHLRRRLCGQFDADRLRGLRAVRTQRQPVVGQRRGRVEPGEHLAPMPFRLLRVLPVQPGQVVVEGSARGQLGRPATGVRRVLLAGLGEDLPGAPPVQQHVVRGPDQYHLVLGDPGDHQPHQRRLGQVQAERPVTGQHRFQFGGDIRFAPVVLVDRHHHLAVHHLHRIVQAGPGDPAAQHRCPIHHPLPGRCQRRRIVHSGQSHVDLVEVGARLGVDQPVEQDSRLERGERVDVLDVPAVTGHEVQLPPVEPGQREVGGGSATGVGPRAVRHDLPQRLNRPLGEPTDRGLLVHGGGVGPAQLQLALGHDAGDVQEAGAGAVGIDVLADTGQPPAVQALAALATPLPVVVEGDLRLHLGGGSGQVAQGAVAQTPARHGTQLFLDGLEGHAPVVTGHLECDRVFAGEPADGAGQVEPLDDLLAAVALHADEHPRRAGPLGQHAADRAEQHVVDLSPVRVRYLVQQSVGVPLGEPDRHRLGGLHGVRAAAVHGQRRDVAVQRGPVRQVPVQVSGPHVLGEPGRPGAVRGRRRGQSYGLAGTDLGVGRFQVLEQHAPGHPVDHQVVHGEEQLVSKEDGPDQWTGNRVEPRLHLGGPGLPILPVIPDQDVRAADHVLHPVPVNQGEPAAQGLMVVDHGCQRGAQCGLVHVLRQLHQHRHGEPVRAGGLEEPALDRGERGGPGDLQCRWGLGEPGLGGEFGHGLPLEDVLGGHPEAGLPGPGDHLDAQDRIPAQAEEVVPHPDPPHAEHLGPDPGQFPLHRGAGRQVTGVGAAKVRLRQRAPVDLAAGVGRQPVQRDEHRGHHVVGQPALEPATQVRLPADDHVGHQPLVPAVLASHHDGRADLRVPEQGRFDLPWLDAEAADLHLLVDAAQVLQHTVPGPPGAVPRGVHP